MAFIPGVVAPRVPGPLRTALERFYRRAYGRLVRLNYRHGLTTTCHRVDGGTIRSYELFDRHGRHDMLADLLETTGPESTIYDVGASVGIYACALAATGSDRTVLAFEPDPRVRAHLRTNVALNDLTDQIRIVPAGVGAEAGSRRFYCSSYRELSGFDRAAATRWGARVVSQRSVPVVTLDDFIDEYPAPDVIKLDVEGHGPAVLRGARSLLGRAEPALFVEPHEAGFGGDRVAELRRELVDLGYRCRSRDRYWRCTPTGGDQ